MGFIERQLGIPSHIPEAKEPRCSFICKTDGQCEEPVEKEIFNISFGITYPFCKAHADEAMIKWASFRLEVV